MLNRRKRILIITRNLPPLIGGMERLNWHMVDELSRHAEVKVIAPTGSKSGWSTNVELLEVPLRPALFFIISSMWRAISTSLQWKPDIVLAGSGLSAPMAWLAARATKGKAIAYLHGLDISIPHPVYQKLWLPIIRKLDRCLVNSAPTEELALDNKIAKDKIHIVHPGVTLPTSLKSRDETTEFKKRHGLNEKIILLSVGRLSRRKGLLEFVENALPQIVRKYPNAVLTVVGGAPNDALNPASHSIDSIFQAAQLNGISESVKFLGRIEDEELLCAYAAAKVHVFPILHVPGDPEGFGMVAIEAAANGLPTVAFGAGGVVDAVSEGKSGYLAPPENYSVLIDQISKILDDNKEEWSHKTVDFAKSFEWEEFGRKLCRALQ